MLEPSVLPMHHSARLPMLAMPLSHIFIVLNSMKYIVLYHHIRRKKFQYSLPSVILLRYEARN